MEGETTDVIRHLKDEGYLAFKTNCQQLIEGTPESIGHEPRANDSSGFTVPVCDEQVCPSELPQDIADHTTTSMSNSPPQDQRTVPSAGLGAEMHVISDSFTDLKEDSQEHPAKCTNCLPLPVTCLQDSYKCNKDDAGKQPGASQPELYLDWNVHRKIEHNLINKGKCIQAV